MNSHLRIIIAFLGVVLLVLMTWYFSNIVAYIIIAAVLSLIGHPLAELLNKVRIGKFLLPPGLSALTTLLVICFLIAGFIMVFVPLVSNQAQMITNIDMVETSEYYDNEISQLRTFLVHKNIIDKDESLVQMLDTQIDSWMNLATFSNIASSIASTTGSLFIGVFSVLFLTFFFLQDPQLLKNFILLLVPDKMEEKFKTILHKSKVLLSRYFIGLMIELTTMMTLISLGLTFFGVKNALIIGFLGGLMNVIPYLGPLIGGSIGVILGVTTTLSLGLYDQIWIVALEVIGTFAVANLIDNIILQPLIYSKSVSAHPIEIFLVIIMAGSLAGIPGMILAIPSYTVLRIVSKEFLGGFKIIDKLTENI